MPAATTSTRRPGQEMPDEYLPPNKILFLQNIPDGGGKGELESLFSAYVALTLFLYHQYCMTALLTLPHITSGLDSCRYSGYTDVQTIPGKASIAFVEFTDIPSSVAARGALNGYNFGAGDKLKVRLLQSCSLVARISGFFFWLTIRTFLVCFPLLS